MSSRADRLEYSNTHPAPLFNTHALAAEGSCNAKVEFRTSPLSASKRVREGEDAKRQGCVKSRSYDDTESHSIQSILKNIARGLPASLSAAHALVAEGSRSYRVRLVSSEQKKCDALFIASHS